jgi:hypothetical protein
MLGTQHTKQQVLEILTQHNWEYVIQFYKNNLKQFGELLKSTKD